MNGPSRHDDLRSWASGRYPLDAATELPIRAFRGRFTGPGWPWMMTDDSRRWIDLDAIDDNTAGALSGGERRLLLIAGSLGSVENRTVNLSQVLPGLDRANLTLVLAAIAHAGGSHEHSDFAPDGRPVRLPSLAPWPAVATGPIRRRRRERHTRLSLLASTHADQLLPEASDLTPAVWTAHDETGGAHVYAVGFKMPLLGSQL